ncbi:MAG: flagellar basal body rod protein FlgC [Armatimonadetes bacterium]|nr:flagellar basal body rod protein FlgC [Armatimonadota bacterium]
MGTFSSFDISASGIYAQRVRMDAVANNIANAETTRTPEGGPYKRQHVTFRAAYEDALGNQVTNGGVRVDGVTSDGATRSVNMPGHPDADANGNVQMPDINVVEEMVDMISATRAYEANVTALNATKSMINEAIGIGKA